MDPEGLLDASSIFILRREYIRQARLLGRLEARVAAAMQAQRDLAWFGYLRCATGAMRAANRAAHAALVVRGRMRGLEGRIAPLLAGSPLEK